VGEVSAATVQTLHLQENENNLFSSVVDSANGYIYFGTNSSPCKIIRIRMSDFVEIDSLSPSTEPQCGNINTAVIDQTGGYGYFTNNTGNPGHVVKVRLSDFTIDNILTLPPGQAWSSAIDGQKGFLYIGATPPSGTIDTGQIFKVDLATFSVVDVFNFPSEYGYPDVLTIDKQGNFLYAGVNTGPGEVTRGAILKINLQTFSQETILELPYPNDTPESGFIDFNEEFIYFSVGAPRIYKLNISDLSIVDTLELDEETFPSGFSLSTLLNNDRIALFVTPGCSGAKLAIVDLRLFSLNHYRQITSNKVGIGTMSLDNSTKSLYLGNLYCRVTSTPGVVIKRSAL